MIIRTATLVGILITAAVAGTGPVVADQHETTSLDDDSLPFASSQQQVLSGETGLAPGTELTVRLRSTDSSTPFLRQHTAYVTENKTFATVFDMSSVPANTTYAISVRWNGTELLRRSETVVACDGNCTDEVPEMPDPPEQSGVVSVEQGDVVTIPVSTNGADTVTFSLGSESVNYLINATLSDDNDDGAVPVQFDTAAAGTDGSTLSVADSGDSLTITRSEPELSATIDAAEYEYRITRTGEEPDEVGTVSITANESATEEFVVDDTPELGFERSIYRTRQGETGQISVALGTAETATVSIGGPENGYEINATVRDGTGDGTVTLLFDTATAGRSGTTLTTAKRGDTVSVVTGSEVDRDTPIDADDYDLTLYRGDSVAGDPADIGTLVVSAGEESVSTEGSEQITTGPATTQQSQLGPVALLGGGILAIGGMFLVVRTVVE